MKIKHALTLLLFPCSFLSQASEVDSRKLVINAGESQLVYFNSGKPEYVMSLKDWNSGSKFFGRGSRKVDYFTYTQSEKYLSEFHARPGLSDPNCVSFSSSSPEYKDLYITQLDSVSYFFMQEKSEARPESQTFCYKTNNGITYLEAVSQPGKVFSHHQDSSGSELHSLKEVLGSGGNIVPLLPEIPPDPENIPDFPSPPVLDDEIIFFRSANNGSIMSVRQQSHDWLFSNDNKQVEYLSMQRSEKALSEFYSVPGLSDASCQSFRLVSDPDYYLALYDNGRFLDVKKLEHLNENSSEYETKIKQSTFCKKEIDGINYYEPLSHEGTGLALAHQKNVAYGRLINVNEVQSSGDMKLLRPISNQRPWVDRYKITFSSGRSADKKQYLSTNYRTFPPTVGFSSDNPSLLRTRDSSTNDVEWIIHYESQNSKYFVLESARVPGYFLAEIGSGLGFTSTPWEPAINGDRKANTHARWSVELVVNGEDEFSLINGKNNAITIDTINGGALLSPVEKENKSKQAFDIDEQFTHLRINSNDIPRFNDLLRTKQDLRLTQLRFPATTTEAGWEYKITIQNFRPKKKLLRFIPRLDFDINSDNLDRNQQRIKTGLLEQLDTLLDTKNVEDLELRLAVETFVFDQLSNGYNHSNQTNYTPGHIMVSTSRLSEWWRL